MASTYLSRTPSSASNLKTWTWSGWVKRGSISTGNQVLFEARDSSGFFEKIQFISSDKLEYDHDIPGTDYTINSERVFRDVNAWYHIVVARDTTQSTEANRIKIYVNGEQVSQTEVGLGYPPQNYDSFINNTNVHYIGANHGSEYFDGSMSHIHFVDGSALAPTVFGETDATTGEWKIKTSPSYTVGTNGFSILQDGNTITDQSTNSNNFALAGGTLTKTEDNPSNVFATLNPLHISDASGNYYLSLGNLRQHVTNNDGHRQTGFTLHPKGLKGYFEVKCTVDPNFHLGLQNVTSRLLNTNYYTQSSPNYYFLNSSNPVTIQYANGGSAATYIANLFSQISVGDIIGCAFDFTGTNKNVWFHKNGTYGNNGSGVGNPATGAYPAMTSTQLTADEYEFIVSPNTGSGNGQLDFNFGNGVFGTTAVSSAGTNASNNGIFEYDVPSGYTALSTKGLNL